jgi:hypothetical protein
MFAPIRLGDLGIFHTVTGFDKTETSLYLVDLPLLSRNKCPRCNSEMFPDYDPRVLGINFISNKTLFCTILFIRRFVFLWKVIF